MNELLKLDLLIQKIIQMIILDNLLTYIIIK
jgi:hypothetical protein